MVFITLYISACYGIAIAIIYSTLYHDHVFTAYIYGECILGKGTKLRLKLG